MATLGVLHPGLMGSAVAAAARLGGTRVVWASESRSQRTRERAAVAGLEDLRTLTALLRASDTVLSVCPPHAALDVARTVAAEGFGGLYVDVNAVSPATARAVASIVEPTGATYVDGGIIGNPPKERGDARLYLAGSAAPRVAALFGTGPLEAIVLDGPIPSASALKMVYAAWTKGTSALLMAIRAVALHEGVDDALQSEWLSSQPDLAARSARAAGSAYKAWRWVGEMEEIAATFAAAGLPSGFHEAAAEVFRSLAEYKDTPTPPTVRQAAEALTRERAPARA